MSSFYFVGAWSCAKESVKKSCPDEGLIALQVFARGFYNQVGSATNDISCARKQVLVRLRRHRGTAFVLDHHSTVSGRDIAGLIFTVLDSVSLHQHLVRETGGF